MTARKGGSAEIKVLLSDASLSFAKDYGLYHKDTSPSKGTTYVYQLRTTGGEPVATSPEVTAGNQHTVPAPSGVKAESGRRSVKVRWKTVDDWVSAYDVFRDGKKLTKQPVLHYARLGEEPGSAELTYYDATAKTGSFYRYTVTATDIFGRSSRASDEVTITFKDIVAPDRPRNLKVTIEDGVAKLTWKSPVAKDVAGYRVYRASGLAGRPAAIASLPKSRNSYEDKLGETGTYFYVVTAYDHGGNETARLKGNKLYAPLVARYVDAVAPAAPSGLKAGVSGTRITLRWNENTEGDFDSFNLYRARSEKGPWILISQSRESASYSETTQRRFQETVYYSVSAMDKAGNESARSQAVSCKIERSQSVKVGGITLKKGASRLKLGGAELNLKETLSEKSFSNGTVRASIPLKQFGDKDLNLKASVVKGKVSDIKVDANQSLAFGKSPLQFTFNEVDPDALKLGGKIQADSEHLKIRDFEFGGLEVRSDGTLAQASVAVKNQEIAIGKVRMNVEEMEVREDGLVFHGHLVTDGAAITSWVRVEGTDGTISLSGEVNIRKWGVVASGSVEYDQETQYASGNLDLEITQLDISAELEFELGSESDYTWFRLAAQVDLERSPIPIGTTPLELFMIGGGIAYNMRADYSRSSNAYEFSPEEGGWIFKAMAGVRTSADDGTAFTGEFTLTISAGAEIRLEGDCTIAEKVDVDALIEYTDEGFLFSATITADFDPVFEGAGTIELFFGAGSRNWYVHFGTEDDPIEAEIFGLVDGEVYVTIEPGSGGGIEFDSCVSLEYGTGRLEWGQFYVEASIDISSTVSLTVSSGRWTFSTSFTVRGSCEAGWRSLEVSGTIEATGRIRCSDGRSVTISGDIEATIVYGRRDREITIDFDFEVPR